MSGSMGWPCCSCRWWRPSFVRGAQLGPEIADLGLGLALPTLVTWAPAPVPGRLRGRATGAWQSSFSFGQSGSPLVVIGLATLVGGRAHAVLVYALGCGVAAMVVGVLLRRRRGVVRAGMEANAAR